MSSPRQVWNGIQAELIGLYQSPPALPIVMIDEPAPQQVAALAKGESAPLISIFDWKIAKNTSRWAPFVQKDIVNPIGITVAVSETLLNFGAQQTLTISGSPTAGDAISCVIQAAGLTLSVVALQRPADTTATLAARLAAAVNSVTELSLYVSAAAVGSVITITNVSNFSLVLQSFTGNGGSRIIQVGTSERPVQIALFTMTEDDREFYGDPILSWIGQKQATYGIQLADDAWARIRYNNDYECKETHQTDIFRRDFVIDVEHSITYAEALYSVLALTPRYTLSA